MYISDLKQGDFFCFQSDIKAYGEKTSPVYYLNKNKDTFSPITIPGSFPLKSEEFRKERVVQVKATFTVVKEKDKYIFLGDEDIVQEGDEFYSCYFNEWMKSCGGGMTVKHASGNNKLVFRRLVKETVEAPKPAVAKTATCEAGYRELLPKETIKNGDEVYDETSNRWLKSLNVGLTVKFSTDSGIVTRYRRKV